MKKQRNSQFIYIGLGILVLVFLFFYLRWNSILSINEVAITSVELSDENLRLEGTLTSSAKYYKDFDYSIEGETLIITLYGTLFKRGQDDLSILISDDLSGVQTILLKDKTEEKEIYKK